MTKTANDRQAKWRNKMKEQGYVMRSFWVPPGGLDMYDEAIENLRKEWAAAKLIPPEVG